MIEKTVTEMNEMEFEALVGAYIDRTAQGYGDMLADIFFDLLLERTTAQVEDTFKLSISIQDNQVVITPDREASTVVVSGNQILVGGHRLILEMA